MKRIVPLLVLLLLPVLPGPVSGQEAGSEALGFFTPDELSRIDEALELLNMSRADTGFFKTVLEDDWRLPIVDRGLSQPLNVPGEVWSLAQQCRGDTRTILLDAGRELGLVSQYRQKAPPGIRMADLIVRQAVDQLPPEEYARLITWAYALLVEEEGRDGLFPPPEEEEEEDVQEMLAIAAKVDRGVLLAAALVLLDELRDFAERKTGESDWLVVAGDGDDVHDLREDPPVVLVDLGGNDRYLAPARALPDHPISIVIDLGGNDTYGDGTDSLTCGAGFLGVGILWDRGDGDDRYLASHLSQGCGLFGVGILLDEGGADVYEARDAGQGAGAFGVGILRDRGEGNDRFHVDLFGQGFAYTGGFGLLHNEKGNDVYDAGGVHLHYPLFNDRFQSLSQGFSIGMRPHASGGIALLVDDEGNDRYCTDIYGQGASYWFSFGALVDRDGNDTYNLGQYGQGGGIHLAVGCLLDLAGQDLYYNMHGVGTGGAHDWAVGILVDRAGDDYYAGSGGTIGGALTNSFALLMDCAGNDGYCPVKVNYTVGGGRAARGMGSAGLFLDLGGRDLYGTREPNETFWTKETYGAGIDYPDPPVEEKPPPNRPRLTPEEAEARCREDAWDEDAGGWDLDALWALGGRWPVGEMADIVPVARDHLFEMGEPVLERALAEVATYDSLQFLCVQHLLKRFGEPAIEPLIGMLEDADHRRRGRAASLLADLGAAGAAEQIVSLLDHEKTQRSALDALARLKAVEQWEPVAHCLDDERELTRASAVRCLQKLGATGATPKLIERLGNGEMFTVRFAAEDVLVSFGEASVEPLLSLAREGEDITARRHAVRALGRLRSAKAAPLLRKLLDHPDWRLRYEAVGALAESRSVADVGAGNSILALWAMEKALAREEHPRVKQLLEESLE